MIKLLGTGHWALGDGSDYCQTILSTCPDKVGITQNLVTRAQKLFVKSTKNRLKYKFHLKN